MPYKNKEDQAASARRHYDSNKDVMKARAKAHAKLRVAKLRAFVGELKNNPCTDCGNTFPPSAMDFDHVGDDKIAEIGRLVTDGVSMKRLLCELAKCELVCACCHRVRTQDRHSIRVHS